MAKYANRDWERDERKRKKNRKRNRREKCKKEILIMANKHNEFCCMCGSKKTK